MGGGEGRDPSRRRPRGSHVCRQSSCLSGSSWRVVDAWASWTARDPARGTCIRRDTKAKSQRQGGWTVSYLRDCSETLLSPLFSLSRARVCVGSALKIFLRAPPRLYSYSLPSLTLDFPRLTLSRIYRCVSLPSLRLLVFLPPFVKSLPTARHGTMSCRFFR